MEPVLTKKSKCFGCCARSISISLIKTILLIVFNAFIYHASFSQTNQFFKHYNDSGSHEAFDIKSLSDGSLIVVGQVDSLPQNPAKINGFIYKINPGGNIETSIIISDSNFNYSLNSVYNFPGDTIIITATKKRIDGNNIVFPDSLIVLKYNQSLQLINKNSYSFTPGLTYAIRGACIDQKNLYIATARWNAASGSMLYSKLALHKIDLVQNTIMHNYIETDTIVVIWDLFYNSVDSTISVWYLDNKKLFDTVPYIYGGRTWASVFDRNLQFVSNIDTCFDYINGVSISQPDNMHNYFVHGMDSGLDTDILSNYKQHPKIYKINQNGSIVQRNEFLMSLDTSAYTGWHGLITKSDGVFSCGFVNGLYNMPFEYERSWIYMAKLDTSLHVQNIRFLGEDYFYMLYAATETADGGIAAVGRYFDYQQGNKVTNVFVIKTDDNLSIGIDEDPILSDLEPHVFPNPAGDFFIIEKTDNTGNLTMQFVSMNGSVLLSQQITSHNSIIDVSGFQSGSYLIFFSRNSKIISVQKIVLLK